MVTPLDRSANIQLGLDADGYVKGLDRANIANERLLNRVNGLNRRLDRLRGRTDRAGRSMRVTGTRMQNLNRFATSAFGPLSGVGVRLTGIASGATSAAAAIGTLTAVTLAGANSFLKLERGLAEIDTLLLGTEFEANSDFRKGIEEVSSTFGITLPDAIDATYQAISAGIPGDNILSFIQESAKFSIAAVTTLNDTVDLATSALNAFGLSADESQRVFDTFIQTIAAGKTTGPELAASIGQVAPFAAVAGVELEEMAAALAALTKAGVSTDLAATQLKNVFKSLVSPTDQATNSARALGLEFNQATLRTQGLVGIFSQLRETGANTAESLNDLFPEIRAAAAAAALSGKQFDDLVEIMQQMETASGRNQEAFNEFTDTAGFKLRRSIETVRREIRFMGEDFVDTAGSMIDAAGGIDSVLLNIEAGFTRVRIVIESLKAIFSNFGTGLDFARILQDPIGRGSEAIADIVESLKEGEDIEFNLFGGQVADVSIDKVGELTRRLEELQETRERVLSGESLSDIREERTLSPLAKQIRDETRELDELQEKLARFRVPPNLFQQLVNQLQTIAPEIDTRPALLSLLGLEEQIQDLDLDFNIDPIESSITRLRALIARRFDINIDADTLRNNIEEVRGLLSGGTEDIRTAALNLENQLQREIGVNIRLTDAEESINRVGDVFRAFEASLEPSTIERRIEDLNTILNEPVDTDVFQESFSRLRIPDLNTGEIQAALDRASSAVSDARFNLPPASVEDFQESIESAREALQEPFNVETLIERLANIRFPEIDTTAPVRAVENLERTINSIDTRLPSVEFVDQARNALDELEASFTDRVLNLPAVDIRDFESSLLQARRALERDLDTEDLIETLNAIRLPELGTEEFQNSINEIESIVESARFEIPPAELDEFRESLEQARQLGNRLGDEEFAINVELAADRSQLERQIRETRERLEQLRLQDPEERQRREEQRQTAIRQLRIQERDERISLIRQAADEILDTEVELVDDRIDAVEDFTKEQKKLLEEEERDLQDSLDDRLKEYRDFTRNIQNLDEDRARFRERIEERIFRLRTRGQTPEENITSLLSAAQEFERRAQRAAKQGELEEARRLLNRAAGFFEEIASIRPEDTNLSNEVADELERLAERVDALFAREIRFQERAAQQAHQTIAQARQEIVSLQAQQESFASSMAALVRRLRDVSSAASTGIDDLVNQLDAIKQEPIVIDPDIRPAQRKLDILEARLARIAETLVDLGQQSLNVTGQNEPEADTSLPGFQRGGRVGGIGIGDKMLALLEPGEHVINKRAANAFRPILEAINSGALSARSFGSGTSNVRSETRNNVAITVGDVKIADPGSRTVASDKQLAIRIAEEIRRGIERKEIQTLERKLK